MMLSASQPTQIQNSGPSGSFFSGRSTIDASSSASWLSSVSRINSLTAVPRIDDIDDEVKEEVDQHDAHRHHQHDALDQQIVAVVDRGDEGVTETWDGEQVLDHEATGQESADVDARRAEQRHRRRSKGVAPHDPALTDALGAGHGDELFLQGGDHVTTQHTVIDDETTNRECEGGQRQTLEVDNPVGTERDVGRDPDVRDPQLCLLY